MFDFLNWHNIMQTLFTTGLLTLCGFLWRNAQKYKKMLNDQQIDNIVDTIEDKLKPILDEIEKLRIYIREVDLAEQHKMDLIVDSCRFRLIQICQLYIKQGYMTSLQYDTVTEVYKLYTGLGGNGQAKTYYNKVMTLPVKGEDE